MHGLYHIGKDRRGAILVEMAFAIPLLLAMILAGTELARYMLLQQKLDAIAITTADLVSQREQISAATVDQIFAATDHIIAPFTFGANGVVIVTSVAPMAAADLRSTGSGQVVAC